MSELYPPMLDGIGFNPPSGLGGAYIESGLNAMPLKSRVALGEWVGLVSGTASRIDSINGFPLPPGSTGRVEDIEKGFTSLAGL